MAIGRLTDPKDIISFANAEEHELICPLFSQHASTLASPDLYEFKYQIVGESDVSKLNKFLIWEEMELEKKSYWNTQVRNSAVVLTKHKVPESLNYRNSEQILV